MSSSIIYTGRVSCVALFFAFFPLVVLLKFPQKISDVTSDNRQLRLIYMEAVSNIVIECLMYGKRAADAQTASQTGSFLARGTRQRTQLYLFERLHKNNRMQALRLPPDSPLSPRRWLSSAEWRLATGVALNPRVAREHWLRELCILVKVVLAV